MDADTRRTNLKRLVDGRFDGRQTDIARALGLTAGRVSQLLTPGQPFGERTARRIEDTLHLAHGSLDKRTPADLGGSSPPVAQEMSLEWRQTPRTVTWGEITSMLYVPKEFEVELPDDAMAPRAPKGAFVTFRSASSASGGDGVLVRDKRGRVHFREYRIKPDGGWTAHAEDPAFPSLDHAQDGLAVIAVFAGIRIGWSQLRR